MLIAAVSLNAAAQSMSDKEIRMLNLYVEDRLDLIRIGSMVPPPVAKTPWTLYGRAYVWNFQGPLEPTPHVNYTLRWPTRKLAVGVRKQFAETSVDLRYSGTPGNFRSEFALRVPL